MERISLIKQLRTMQLLIGSLAIFYFLLTIIGSIIGINTTGQFTSIDILNIFIFLGIGISGVFLVRRRNSAVYFLLILFTIEIGWNLFYIYPLLIILDGIGIILCGLYLYYFQQYKDEQI